MSGIVLTQWNIENGRLTDRQLTDFAGYPVVTAQLFTLPYWDVIKQGVNLPDKVLEYRFGAAINARANAIYNLLDNAHMTEKYGGSFSGKDADELAKVRYPVVRSTALAFDPPENVTDHFRLVQNIGVDAAVDPVRSRYWGANLGQNMPYVFPGVLSEDIPVSVRGGGLPVFKKYAAFMLLNGESDHMDELWAMELGLPVGCAKRIPNQKIHQLFCILHEARHLIQVCFDSRPLPPEAINTAEYFNNYITSYYEETDADMTPSSLLRCAKFGYEQEIQEMLTMDSYKRYMGVLFNHPKYWFAPFLDALEKGDSPPDFYAVHQSVMEIRLRLLAEADRLESACEGQPVPLRVEGWELNQAVALWRKYPSAQPYQPYNPKVIAGTRLTAETMVEPSGACGWTGLDNLYLAWRDKQFFQKPEIFYTILRNSVVQGDFWGNQLTQKIAGKIIQAAEYFNPALTREPNVAALVHIPRTGSQLSFG